MPRRWLGLREGWASVLLLAGANLAVVWAIQRADWADDLDTLTPIALGGILLGLALAKWRRLPALLAHLGALLAGGVLIVHQLDPLLPLARDGHGWWPAFQLLRERAQVWVQSAGTDKYADDFYLFLLGIAAIVWIVAYTSAWLIYRLRAVWPALLLPAVVLLFNLGYAPADLSSYLVIFLLCGLLLVARLHVALREDEWRREGVPYPESLGWRTLWVGLIVAVLVVTFGWAAPITPRGSALQAAWSRINTPWQQVESRFNQVFGSLRGPGARGVGNFAAFGDRFRLGGPLKLSQNPILVLQGDAPYYLKVRTFDTFDGHQWDSRVGDTFNSSNDGQTYVPQIDLKAGQELAVEALAETSQHELSVRMLAARGNALFTAEQFVKSSQDAFVQLSWTQYRNQIFDLTTTRRDDLPPDLRHLYDLLKSAPTLRDTDDQGRPLPLRAATPTPTAVDTATATSLASPRVAARGSATLGTQTPTPSPSPQPPPPSPTQSPQQRAIAEEQVALAARTIQARPIVRRGQAVALIVNGQMANYSDVEVVLPREGLQRGTQYKSTILSSNARAPQLRDAGGDYPEWVVRRYLQLPGSTTERTRALAREIAGQYVPYDAAMTIQNYLRDNVKYNENINFPPAERDVVDYLLFDSKQGYCEYYSTAMVVMLRSLGIPAREVVGLFSGEFNAEQGGYIYRESNAHAWVEVYFPNYGWIAFEPTTPRAPFEREVAGQGDGEVPAANGGGDGASGAGSGLEGDGLLPDDRGFGSLGYVPPKPPNRVWQATRIAVPVLALLTVILAVLWLRGLRGLTPTGQFYARLTRSGSLAGVRPAPGTTPYEYAREVGNVVPGTRRSLDQITNLYVREQYGAQQPTIQEVRLVQRAWLQFRAALLRSVVTFRRARPVNDED